MQVKQSIPMPSALENQDQRHPSGNEVAVLLRWDGEPKRTDTILNELNSFESEIGFESDNLSTGGTIQQLERRFCEMLNKEAAAFIPTGTLANHLALRRLCGLKPRAIVQEQSHLYNDTSDCVTRLSSIKLHPLGNGKTCFSYEELKAAIEQVSETGTSGDVIGAVMIESPVRNQRGRIVPYGEMESITSLCKEWGISTHLDGARLYMMSGVTGIPAREYAALFDTVYVSMYKYFGAPYGAILAGTSEVIQDVRQDRRMFGGSLASSYLAAGMALNGAKDFEERFGEALKKAKALFELLNNLPGISIKQLDHGSNIYPVELGFDVDVQRFISILRQNWVFVYPDREDSKQFNFTVNTTILRQDNSELVKAFEQALQ